MQQQDDDDIKGVILNNPLRVQVLPDKTVIDYYLPLEIDADPKEYIDFFRALRDARPTDEVIVHINCYGGEAATAFQIIDNMRASQATILVSIEGACCSAATFVALAGDSWDVMPHSYFMCHAYSTVLFGKRQEVNAATDFDKKWLDRAMREIYNGFLTEDEINLLMEGKDYYFDADEVIDRLNTYKKDDFERQAVVNDIVEKHQKLINDELEKALDSFDKAHTVKETKPKAKAKGRKTKKE